MAETTNTRYIDLTIEDDNGNVLIEERINFDTTANTSLTSSVSVQGDETTEETTTQGNP